jgi:hypothetical protein
MRPGPTHPRTPSTPRRPGSKGKPGPGYDHGSTGRTRGRSARRCRCCPGCGAGQGSGPVVGHDGGDVASIRRGESLRSLASRAPRASSPSTALATWQASRESPLWVSWRLTPARRSGRWPGSSCPGTAGTPGPATPRRPGAGGSAPSGTGRRRSPGPARGGRGASAKSTANPAQGAAPGWWSGRGRRVLDLTEHDPLQLVRVGPEELIAGPQPGCSAAACSSNSHGPITRWPQPSSGHPHFSHGSPGSWWARSPAGRPRRTAAATPQKTQRCWRSRPVARTTASARSTIIWGRREDRQHVQHECLRGRVVPGGRGYLRLSSTRIRGALLVQRVLLRTRSQVVDGAGRRLVLGG